MPSYRFHCSITDTETGETVIEDFTSIVTEEMALMYVESLLRQFNRTARREYEAREYPQLLATATCVGVKFNPHRSGRGEDAKVF